MNGRPDLVGEALRDYHVQRHPVYRAMKERLGRKIADLEAEVARLQEGVLGELKPAEVRELPLFQQLRERHWALKRENEALRAELRQVLPTPYAVRKSEEYRSLRSKHDAVVEELRSNRREVRRLRWAEEMWQNHRDSARWAIETLNRILPPRAFEPQAMVDWHLEQAALWADVAKLPLTALISRLRYMREDGLDAHRNHREEHGYVPAALRMKLLHEGAECARCGKTEDLSIDHIVPLLHGGTSEESNLQVLCRRCNSRKGARLEAATTNGAVPTE